MRSLNTIVILSGLIIPLTLIGCYPTAAVHAEAPSAAAAEVQPSSALRSRAEQLVALINGQADPRDLFAPEALVKAPAERWTALASTIRQRRGNALGVARIEADRPNAGRVFIDFPDSQFSVKIRVQDSAPHLIDGLMVD